MATDNVETLFELSPMQQGMLFHSLYAPTSGIYVEQIMGRLMGRLDVTALERAWQMVIGQHQILRSSFFWKDLEQPTQVVHREVNLPLIQHDWRELSPEDQQLRLESLIAEDRAQGFEFTQAPLMRVILVRLTDSSYQLIWTSHHILLDGWSQSLVLKEVCSAYRALTRGEEIQLEPSRPFGDYEAWRLQQDQGEAEVFWRETMRGFETPIAIGIDLAPGTANQEQRYEEAAVRLSPAATASLQAFARQHRLTMYTLVQAAWALLLSRYSGEEDIVFGTTVSVRPPELEGIESTAGLFINTLPVRAQVSGDAILISWLKELQTQSVEARDFEHTHLVDIQQWSEVPAGQSLFDSILVFENYPTDDSIWGLGDDLKVSERRSIVSRTNYPLTLLAMPGAELTLNLVYDGNRFDQEAVSRLLGHLRALLEGMIQDAHLRLSELRMLTPAEQHQLVREFNPPPAASEDVCVQQLFEQQAALTPDRIAVQFDAEKITYAELDARANQLARRLQKLGVRSESLVGIYVERSIEMVVGLLGILKCGGAYIPLDPAFPHDRLAFMIEDSGLRVLLTQKNLIAELPAHQARVLAIDEDADLDESDDELAAPVSTDQLAYVIYTSGSTGRPKGVQIEHRALTNFLQSVRREPGLNADDILLSVTTLSFDIAALEIYLPLITGARLVIASRDTASDGLQLKQLLTDSAATVMQATPASWRMLLDAEWTGDRGLKVLCGGEALSRELANQLLPQCASLWNMYGPTETTIWSSVQKIESDQGPVSIGRPLANTQMFILDRTLNPAPIGAPGELYIGGDGLARGYLYRAELTAEKFIPNPFGNPGQRLYRTGDLARHLPGGNIECLGRADDQVKVRGFRIELGEIEATINQHPSVRQSVVIAREDTPGNKRLVAYIIYADGAETNAADLRRHIKGTLPDYMVPAAFVELIAMPLTPNGKVNRRALPAPDFAVAAHDSYVSPRTEPERLLAGIWAEVLHVDAVGAEDNFFELGGHSLLATQVISRVLQAFDVQLPLRALFEAPTVSAFCERIAAAQMAGDNLSAPLIKAEARHGEAFLSFGQQSFWFLNQLNPETALYNIYRALRIRGPLEITPLQRALNEVVTRHESLRTTLAARGEEPMQVIAPSGQMTLKVIDLRDVAVADLESVTATTLTREAHIPFDISVGPLIRATLIRLHDEEHFLLLTMHHVVSDDWSMGVLFRELFVLYESFAQGNDSPLMPLPIQYADFATWQHGWMQGDVVKQQLEYWKEQLAGAPRVLQLPTDRPRPVRPTHEGAREEVVLPVDLIRKLTQVGQREGGTLFMTLLAAFQNLLARYTGQADIVVGTPIAGRNRAETEGLIGYFINTLVLRTDVSGNPSFSELIRRVRHVSLGAYAHQDLPFERLVEELQPERSLTQPPLFQVMFIFQNAPEAELHSANLTMTSEEVSGAPAPLDLTMELREMSDGMHCWFEYQTELFDAATIKLMGERFRMLLEKVSESPEQSLSSFQLLTAAEEEQMFAPAVNESEETVTGQCIHELFEAQVERTPSAIAVIHEKEKLTYAELNKRANHLAHHLRTLGVGPEVLVGICMERSIEMIVGVLAALKAGGAYVPLDPTYPRERLAYMLDDTMMPVVITRERQLATLSELSATIICIDSDWDHIAAGPGENPARLGTAANLAYVIYTSGSTGRPKGVMVQHSSLVNYTDNASVEFGLGHGDRVLQFASLNFDTSAEEIFPCLTRGAKLVLRTTEMLASVEGFLQRCRDWAITVLDLPTAYWHEMVTQIEAESIELPPSLRLVIIGGERALPQRLASWQEHFGSEVRLVNTYGPTEATIVATLWEPPATGVVIDSTREVPIGKPVPNTRAYILDPSLRPVPPGVTGELHIGGSGLARGYLNRAELTAEKFLTDPFSRLPGARLYKTGDLARFLPDGNIEYAGRIDDQVKVRGFRIELGEIAATVNQHPTVSEAVVVARDNGSGDKRLVAYLVANSESADSAELREFLAGKLPDYMLPSAFIWLDKLPLAPNGKLDRLALPAPGEAVEGHEAFEPPQTPVEETMAAIWAEVLGVNKVGRNDNFFELGGHSLLATRMISRVRQAMQVDLTLRSLFESPTVAGLAEIVDASGYTAAGPASTSIPLVSRDSELPLSFAQQRLWFIERLEPGSFVYNVNRAMRLKGHLDVESLQQAIDEVVRRHEILRTNFIAVDGAASQVIAPDRQVSLNVVDGGGQGKNQRADVKRLLRDLAELPFDLATDSLLRVTLVRLAEDQHILLLSMHHIICDGWSMGLLCAELASCYQAALAGAPVSKSDLAVQYADFASWQRQLLTSEVFETQLSYWQRQLEGVPAVLEMPTDRSRPAVQTFRGARESFVIPTGVAAELQSLSRREGVTLFMTLLAAWQCLLHRYTGENDIVVGSPIAGRNCTDAEDLIGLFVNALALRTDLSGNPTFQELLGRVREVTLGAFAHQDLPFEKLVEELRPERNLSYNPIFQVVFALQNGPTQELQLADLESEVVDLKTTTAKFDLTLDILESQEGLSCSLEYNSDLFDAGRIKRALGHFQTMLQGIVSDPAQRVSSLPLLSETEQQHLIIGLNDTATDYPATQSIPQLFEEQVALNPDATAVIFGEQEMTYRELNRRANQLAWYLRKLGVGPEVAVGIRMDRSIEMVLALVGIVKAGGGYLPLDLSYPPDRVAFMLDDARVSVLLTEQHLVDSLPETTARVVSVDTIRDLVSQEPEANPDHVVTPQNLIYIIYTSGSTGNPKGVLIPQQAVTRLVRDTNYVALKPSDRIAQASNASFDAATFEIWGAFLNGACVVGVSKDIALSPRRFAEELRDQQISVMFLTTALFNQIARDVPAAFGSMRQLMVGGEAVDPQLFKVVLDQGAPERLLNVYGPTETTTFATWQLVTAVAEDAVSIPIGRPISNTYIRILDQYLNAVPVGVDGQIYIGGPGLAREYLGRPDLTSEKFIPDPYSADRTARLYKTGDTGRYLADGSIEYIGRLDQQVKIRGFRIELTEIEALLNQHAGVRESVVLARADVPGEKRLVAYLVPAPGADHNTVELRRHLQEKLPEYMVPAIFVFLDSLPLSPNGKVERKLLPAPGEERPELEKAFVAPRTEVETRLTAIWEKALAVRPIGIQDNFFELGGHSLLAVRLFAQIEKAFGHKLPLAILFQAPTIERLAQEIQEQALSESWSALVPIQPSGSKQPIFCVHAVGGNVLEYHELARHLGPDQPFYGLQSLGLDGKQAPLTCIEEMAACYLKEMRKAQPHGPYMIGGRSFGGIVAFEMACQLRAQGQEVNLLALLDTYPVNYFRREPGSNSLNHRAVRYARRMWCHVQNLGQLSLREKFVYAGNKCQYIPAKTRRIVMDRVFGLYKRIARPLPQVLRSIEQMNYSAMRDYVPQVYPGTVTLFLASGDMTASYDLKEGWQALAAGGVEIHEIDGDHINIIKEPFVGQLAAELGACIDENSVRSRRLEVAA